MLQLSTLHIKQYHPLHLQSRCNNSFHSKLQFYVFYIATLTAFICLTDLTSIFSFATISVFLVFYSLSTVFTSTMSPTPSAYCIIANFRKLARSWLSMCKTNGPRLPFDLQSRYSMCRTYFSSSATMKCFII